MLIFNFFSLGFSSLCHSVVFVLFIFSFCKIENFYVSTMDRLRQRRKNETKSNVNKIMKTYLVSYMKKSVSSIDEKITRNDNNKLKSFISLQRLIKLQRGPKF